MEPKGVTIVDELTKKTREAEQAADRLIAGEMSLDDIEVWLDWKGRCRSGEIMENVVRHLLSEARWAEHYFKKWQSATKLINRIDTLPWTATDCWVSLPEAVWKEFMTQYVDPER